MTVSIIELKRNLNLTDDQDDVFLQTLADAATARVNLLVDPELLDEAGNADLDLAIMQLVAFWYENREGARTVPDGVYEIVAPYRTWAF
jgi:hypothetical protein